MTFNEFQAMRGALHSRSQLEVYETIFKKASSIVEFFRPAQIDRHGNINNSVIGNFERPKVRLPGAFGIPDVFSIYPKILIYCPRHEKRVFVKKVDFISALGLYDKESNSNKEIRIISNLGTFYINKKTKGMKILTAHPGVDIEEIKENTGFELKESKVPKTDSPTKNQLRLIREKIDPMETRKLEVLSGKKRLDLLNKIIEKEEFAWPK